MEEIKIMLEERETYLQLLKEEKEKMLKGAPEGYLRVCQSRNKIQYYERTNPKDFSGTYINDVNMKIAYQLAQKDYDQKILRAIEKELKAIQRYKEAYPNKTIEQIYDSLHPARQRLILPIRESDEEFIAHWENVEYKGKDFFYDTSEHYTAKGERVRSKSEVIIADALNRAGIPYRYEYPLYIKGLEYINPDFTILDVKRRKEIIWEHLGLMDKPEYAENNVYKINCYERSGYHMGDNLICTFETKQNPLNQKLVKEIILRHFNIKN